MLVFRCSAIWGVNGHGHSMLASGLAPYIYSRCWTICQHSFTQSGEHQPILACLCMNLSRMPVSIHHLLPTKQFFTVPNGIFFVPVQGIKFRKSKHKSFYCIHLNFTQLPNFFWNRGCTLWSFNALLNGTMVLKITMTHLSKYRNITLQLFPFS